MPPQKQGALDYWDNGHEIFPLIPGKKLPAVKWGQDWEEYHFTSREQVANYWDEHPDANVGVHCGKSAIFVMDFDSYDAMDRFARLWFHHEGSELADYGTPVVRTRRGWQVLFDAPDPPLHNTTPLIRMSRCGHDELGEGIDTRGADGMVVGVGSVTCYDGDGNRVPPHTYRLISGDLAKPLPLPSWLEQLLRGFERHPSPRSRSTRTWKSSRYAEQQVRDRCARLAVALPGNRNSLLNKTAWQLQPAMSALGPEYVEAELLAAAVQAELPEDEARRTIRSGLYATTTKETTT